MSSRPWHVEVLNILTLHSNGYIEQSQHIKLPGSFEFTESLSDKTGRFGASDGNSHAHVSNPFETEETDDMANNLQPPYAQSFGAKSGKSMTHQMIEELESLRKGKHALEKELKEVRSWEKELNNIIDERHREARREEEKRVEAERQLQETRKELHDYRSHATRSHSELEQKSRQLTKKLADKQKSEETTLKQLAQARDHIFRLQPRRTDITETEAQTQFGDLYNSVHRWVTNRLEKILDELDSGQLYHRAFPNPAAKRVLSLSSARAIQHMQCHQSDEFVVIAVIMRFLCRAFFDQSFYCPLRKVVGEYDAIYVVDSIETSMRRVPRGKLTTKIFSLKLTVSDASNCRDWRVEALTALVNEPDFVERRSNHEREKTEELLYLLAPLVPNAADQELRESIGRNIIRPAMDLAHRLQLSATVFTIRWTKFDDDLQSGVITSTRVNLSSFISLNVLLCGKVVETPAELQAMTYLFDVAPGLYSQTLSNQTSPGLKSLCKSRILVAVGEGSPVSPAEGPTLLQWIRSEADREESAPLGVSKEVRAEDDRKRGKKHSSKSEKWNFLPSFSRSTG